MRTKKFKKKSAQKSMAVFERLEDRQLYSVVSVTPNMNFVAAIQNSNPGDTISFGAGTYTFNSRTSLPGNRVYQGNGVATITSSSSSVAAIDFDSVTNAEFTGFTVAGTTMQLNNCQVNIHNNTFQNPVGDGIYGTGIHDSQINHNTFIGAGDTGVMLWPGSNNTIDYNVFTNCVEGIHIMGPSTGTGSITGIDASYNVITGIHRNAIEIQNQIYNLTVTHNWIGQFSTAPTNDTGGAAHMALSIATGGGNNITIADNTLLLNGVPGETAPAGASYALTGIEIFGTNISLTGNYVSGAGGAIMNASVGPTVSNGNTFICVNRVEADDPAGGPISGTDMVYAWNATNAPPPPTVAQTLGGATAGASGTSTSASAPVVASAPAPVVSTTPAPTNLTATSPNDSEVDLSWTDNTKRAATYLLQSRASNSSAGFQTIATLPAGTTSYQDTTVNAEWEYDYQLTAVVNGVSSANTTVHTQVQPAPAPVVVVPVVTIPTAPVVTTPVVTAPTAPVVTAAPTNVAATSPSSTEVDLSWTDNTSGAATYLLQRRATYGTSGFQTIATLSSGTISYKDQNVNPLWEYDYQLTAVVNGVSSAIATAHVQVQATPVISTPVVSAPVVSAPVSAASTAAPTNFSATSPNSWAVDLTWTDNTNGQATYVLQRRATHGTAGYQAVATIAPGVTSYQDLQVNAKWEYDYRLIAVQSGVASTTVSAHVQVLNTSIVTPTVTVTTPAAPTVLLASSPNSSEVDLSWVDNTGGTASYVLARRASNGSAGFQIIAVLSPGTTTFKDTNASAQWEYDYYLVAVVPGAASAAATAHIQVQSMLSLLLPAA